MVQATLFCNSQPVRVNGFYIRGYRNSRTKYAKLYICADLQTLYAIDSRLHEEYVVLCSKILRKSVLVVEMGFFSALDLYKRARHDDVSRIPQFGFFSNAATHTDMSFGAE